ncbi:B-box type zinc finger family protein [Striga hermonthica]|uniref:B-box type zinc finger family protein n=1 Tax=Striga hermonthica TaxID=68872 RepID=A0A9N7R7Y1_STRHE|nr:B-box type zinc finger family protein [Striga hermonthica]
MSRKDCELCGGPARMFCESDDASLCWDCDEKVHAANFLVAKHSRTLLCHACYSPTPWKAAGLRLGHAFSVCSGCAVGDGENRRVEESTIRRGDEDGGLGTSSGPPGSESESESDDGEYFSDTEGSSVDEDEDAEEEDGENQVVPWSDSGSIATPQAAASYSSREENASRSSSKRTREIAFESEDDDGCSSWAYPDANSQLSDGYSGSNSLSLSRMPRRSHGGGLLESPEHAANGGHNTSSSGTAAIVEKLSRYH